MTLSNLVKEFRRDRGPLRVAEALPFQTSSVAIAVRRAALSVRADGKRHSHQCRIPAEVLRQCAMALDRALPRIRNCKDFEALYTLVESEIGHIHGVGELLVYDVAERIGIRLELNPQMLYMHAGTREGARKLGVAGNTAKITQFPNELHSLSYRELEDFLCNYKARL